MKQILVTRHHVDQMRSALKEIMPEHALACQVISEILTSAVDQNVLPITIVLLTKLAQTINV